MLFRSQEFALHQETPKQNVTVKMRRARLLDAVQITVVNQIEAIMVGVVTKKETLFPMQISANQIVSA